MKWSFVRTGNVLHLLRVVVSILLMVHGSTRIIEGSVNDFGEYLAGRGFHPGRAIAWAITCFEVLGGLMMSIGFLARWIAIIFFVEIAMGIILVHASNGWFVVGKNDGGVEYSILLLAVLLTVAVSSGKTPSRTISN